MNLVYFRNISEKISDINFYDNPLLRAEFFRNDRQTDRPDETEINFILSFTEMTLVSL